MPITNKQAIIKNLNLVSAVMSSQNSPSKIEINRGFIVYHNDSLNEPLSLKNNLKINVKRKISSIKKSTKVRINQKFILSIFQRSFL